MQEIVDVLNREQFIDMLYQLVNTMSDLKQGKVSEKYLTVRHPQQEQ